MNKYIKKKRCFSLSLVSGVLAIKKFTIKRWLTIIYKNSNYITAMDGLFFFFITHVLKQIHRFFNVYIYNNGIYRG